MSVVIVGIASLLASSPAPVDAAISVVTLNNPEASAYYDSISYACQNERVRLVLEANAANGGVLSAEPPESFKPTLSELEVANSSELELTALADAALTLQSANPEVLAGKAELRILDDSYCTNFAFPLVGFYKGELSQTSPREEALAQNLRLFFEDTGDPQVAVLYLSFGGLEEQDGEHVFFGTTETYPCTLDEPQGRLTCEAIDESFSLSASITAEGLSGNYSGTLNGTDALIPFEGSLLFEKLLDEQQVPQ